MGLLRKTISSIAEKALSIAVDEGAVEKVLQKEKVKESINGVYGKLNKVVGVKEEKQIVDEMPYLYKYFIRKQSPVCTDLIFDEIKRDLYHVYDDNDRVKYIIEGTRLMGKSSFVMKDTNGQKIGTVKKAWIEVPGLFEKEMKSCSIVVDDINYCSLSRYIYFGDIKYNIEYKNLKVDFNKFETEYKIYSKECEKSICQISKYYSNDLNFRDKYVVGIDLLENEIPMILIAVGIDLIRYG